MDVGPCSCGGYGVLRCHVPLEEATAVRATSDSPRARHVSDTTYVSDPDGSYVLLYDPRPILDASGALRTAAQAFLATTEHEWADNPDWQALRAAAHPDTAGEPGEDAKQAARSMLADMHGAHYGPE